MKFILTVLFLFLNIFKGYCSHCDSVNYSKNYTLMVVQLKTIVKDSNQYVINFIPIGTYANMYIKLVMVDSAGKLDTIKSGQTEYHKKLSKMVLTKLTSHDLLKLKPSLFTAFLEATLSLSNILQKDLMRMKY